MFIFIDIYRDNEMINETIIDEAVKSLFEEIEFTKDPAGLYDPLRYMIEIGGKRLRPRLALTTYSLYKDSFDQRILRPAAGLEVFHSFTLIHDDIMDRSALRRKAPTVWKKWGSDTAILSGDVMCIDSYSRIAKAPVETLPAVMKLFSKTAAQVCEGQQLDMEFEEAEVVPMERYMTMIGLKTGVLIACSAAMGALIGGAPAEDCEALYNFGFNLGLAFQVTDDFLDAFGDEKVFGKPIGGDIINNKKSWLTVRAMEKADKVQRQSLLDALALPSDDDVKKSSKIQRVKDLYVSLNVDEDAKATILKLNSAALDHARDASASNGYTVLSRFAEKLIGRTS